MKPTKVVSGLVEGLQNNSLRIVVATVMEEQSFC